MPETWVGEVTHCQLCEQPLGMSMVDGVVRGHGWANLCKECHDKFGIGLGPGKGQMYQWDGHNWIKIQG